MTGASPAPSPWWDAARHADRRGRLMARGAIRRRLRDWFEAQGFVEVEPACLQVSPGNEAHLHAFATDLVGPDLTRRRLHLHTSPEFAMKKLLAAGEQRIFAFAPVFRNRERGALHAPEFTMLEWYRVGEPYDVLWADCAAILALAADATGRRVWDWRGRTCEIGTADIDSLRATSVADAFGRHAGLVLAEAYDRETPDAARLRALADGIGVHVGGSNDAPPHTWSDLFARILTERVDPHLGSGRPEVLYRYPVSEAALAQVCADDPRFAERFELYACGVELANGFAELTDPAEQRRRFQAEMALKAARYGERYPIDEDFLAALAHMPPASGCAMGFDRLVMLATAATHIDDVLWTPLLDAAR